MVRTCPADPTWTHPLLRFLLRTAAARACRRLPGGSCAARAERSLGVQGFLRPLGVWRHSPVRLRSGQAVWRRTSPVTRIGVPGLISALARYSTKWLSPSAREGAILPEMAAASHDGGASGDHNQAPGVMLLLFEPLPQLFAVTQG